MTDKKKLTNWIDSNKYSLLIFILTLILLLLLAFLYDNKVFALHFVDEEDNFALGKFLLGGQKLYSDLFSHHQPLGYILSALIQQITNPNSIYLLIKRHREFMIAYSSLWLIFLVARFGLPILLFSLIFEPIKYLLLGNLFLSESLSVYPLVYLCLIVTSRIKNLSQKEFIYLGFSTALILFLLAPLWPAVLLIIFLLVIKFRNEIKRLLIFGVVGFFPLLIISLFFISIPNYFYNVFIINFFYYIPQSAQITKETSPLYAIFAPFLSLSGPFNNGPSLWVIRSLVLLLIFNSFILIKNKSYFLLGTIFLILALANLRFIRAGSEYYNGFHLLPWLAVLTIFGLITFKLVLEQSNTSKIFKIGSAILVGITILISITISTNYLFAKNDINHDFYVNYSQFFNSGEAVRIMKSPGERLFVAPDGWLIYWQADIGHASPMINYYNWMRGVPKLNGYVTQMFAINKPTYFYCDCFEQPDMQHYLQNYQVMKKDGKATQLYVLMGKLDKLDSLQKQQLEYLNYQAK